MPKTTEKIKSFFKIFSIIAFSTFIFIGCDNEPLSEDIELNDPSNPETVDVPEADIIGTWDLSDLNLSIDQTITGSFGGESINGSQVINMEQQSGGVTITFSENGEYTSQGTATVRVTGTQDGEAIPETTETLDSPFSSGTWSVANGQLTMISPDATADYLITSFTGNNMNLFSNEDLPIFDDSILSGAIPDFSGIPGFEDFPELNFEVEQDYEAEFSLTKID